MTYQYSKSHPLGTVWVNSQYRIVYLNIPKNASSTLKAELGPRGFQQAGFQYDDSWRTFTVIREPRDRLISGLCEYAWRNGLDNVKVAKQAAEQLQAGVWKPLDEHTTPQHEFILFPISVLIPMEDVTLGVPRLLRRWGMGSIPDIPKHRVTEPAYKQQVADVLAKVEWTPNPVDELLYQFACSTHHHVIH